MVCVTRYGSYEFLVMPFGLTSAPATFNTSMNKIFHPYLDKFVVVYFDDIVVFTQTLEDHADNLRVNFSKLGEHHLFVKREKCSFTQMKVTFVGHKIKYGTKRIDKSKVKEILDWEVPTNIKELRSFLGLTNYYGRFIKGYLAKVAALVELLKNDQGWNWFKKCQGAFEDLKKAVIEKPVLAQRDTNKAYEVQTDAPDFTSGGVLLQDGHPIMFKTEAQKESDGCRPLPSGLAPLLARVLFRSVD